MADGTSVLICCLLFSLVGVLKAYGNDVQIYGPTYVSEGDTIRLQCNSTSTDYSPPDEVAWYIESIKLEPGDRGISSITTERTQQGMGKSLINVLVIGYASKRNEGFYVCRTSSNDYASHRLFVISGSRDGSKRGGGMAMAAASDRLHGKSNAIFLTSLVLFFCCLGF